VFVMLVVVWGYYVYVYIVNLSGKFEGKLVTLARPMDTRHYVCLCAGIYPGISHSAVWSGFLKVLFLMCAHILLFLLLVSYYRTIFTVHKDVPESFYLTDDQLEELDLCVSVNTVV